MKDTELVSKLPSVHRSMSACGSLFNTTRREVFPNPVLSISWNASVEFNSTQMCTLSWAIPVESVPCNATLLCALPCCLRSTHCAALVKIARPALRRVDCLASFACQSMHPITDNAAVVWLLADPSRVPCALDSACIGLNCLSQFGQVMVDWMWIHCVGAIVGGIHS